ncbi:MAG: AraC family transcriptional regulator [Saccharofermentanales bacterium]|jgi:AraC-like DNA-binding protein
MLEDLLPTVEKGLLSAAGSIPVVFKGIERSFEKGEAATEPSRHEYHELTYLRSGKAEFEVAGRKLMVERGGAVIIRPQMTHVVRIPDGYADMMVVYFGFTRTPSEAAANAEKAGNSNAAQTGQIKRTTDIAPATIEQFLHFAYGSQKPEDGRENDPMIQIKGRSRREIAALMERILYESRNEAFGKELMMQLLAIELLVVLARGLREEWEESLRVRTGKARELVKIAREYIVENHDRDISVADIAGYVFLSQGYFTRAFREETGMSPMAFMMQVRVNRACKLLEQRDMKVSGIAELVGFSSPQRFNAAFRKHVGMTPMEYRKQVQERKYGAE